MAVLFTVCSIPQYLEMGSFSVTDQGSFGLLSLMGMSQHPQEVFQYGF